MLTASIDTTRRGYETLSVFYKQNWVNIKTTNIRKPVNSK